jgi:hypothetical protein
MSGPWWCGVQAPVFGARRSDFKPWFPGLSFPGPSFPGFGSVVFRALGLDPDALVSTGLVSDV